MRNLLIAGVALLSLVTTAAYAGDGNGEPFPGPDAAVTTRVNPNGIASGNDDPFHYYGTSKPVSTSGFKLNANNPDDPFPYKAAGTVVSRPAPTVGPSSPAPTVTAGHTPAPLNAPSANHS
jgi:hypothetical protein